mgnify:FL=1
MHFEIDNRAEALRSLAEMTDCEKAEMEETSKSDR